MANIKRANTSGITKTGTAISDVPDARSFWEAPTPMPVDDKFYTWDEETLSWEEVAP